MNTTSKPFLTPPQLAADLGCKPSKIIAWIESGELRALNLAKLRKGRKPRYQVRVADWEAFLLSREVQQRPEPPKRVRIPKATKEYF